MALDISKVSQSLIDETEALLIQVISDEYPSLDLSPGRVLRELLIRPAALLYALNQTDIDLLRKSMSLQQIALDPSLATDEIVDGVLSNLLIFRKQGAKAKGQIKVILSEFLVTPIDNSAVFTFENLNFKVTQAFVGVTDANNVVSSGARLITQRADGLYEFLIDVEAEKEGEEYNVGAGARFTTTVTIPNLVDLIAESDFSGGQPLETNQNLVDRVQTGLSAKILSGRSHIESLLSDNYQVKDISIIGFGDKEMIRDRHNLFEISQGGKVDIYVRTETTPVQTIIQASATLVDVENKEFSITFDRDQMAGVYKLLGIYRENETPYKTDGTDPTFADSLEIISQTWGLDLSKEPFDFVPDILNLDEAGFSRFRSLSLRFRDPDTTLDLNETGKYNFYFLMMPDIKEIQDFVSSREIRSPAADYLVKTPFPALCSIALRILSKNPENLDTTAIKTAIVNRVNSLTFEIGRLPASVIIDAAQGQLDNNSILELPINMMAKILLPDGTEKIVTDAEELRVPETDNVTVSENTTSWFLKINDIDIEIVQI